jgi:hypothetical protein
MSGVEIDIARAALVIGIVIAAVMYHHTRVVSGGAVTGAYLTLMVLGNYWETIAGWAVLSLVGLGAIKLTARLWPVPRSWLFAIGVIAPATLHVIGLQLAGIPQLDNYSTFLAAGLYVTNGLTAYEAQRQGVVRTFAAVAIVTALTTAVTMAVSWGMSVSPDPTPTISEVSLDSPLVVLVCIITAFAVRLGVRWGTAGIVGSLFLLNLLSIASLVVILAFTVVGTVIYRAVANRLGLTPRERLYSLLAVGAISAWFGLFWASWLGIPGAADAARFGVEPLLVIGLMIGESQRHGISRMLGGTAIVAGVTFAARALLEANPTGGLWVFLLCVTPAVIMMALATKRMRHEWSAAIAGGDTWQSSLPPSSKNPSQRKDPS